MVVMEYKKPESFYEILKEIGRSLYYNFISGDPQPDGSVYKKNMEWGLRFPNKKNSEKVNKTIDDKI